MPMPLTKSAPLPPSSFALRSIALLEGLDTARLDALAQACRWRTVPARQLLAGRAEHTGDVYFLVSGTVRVTHFSPQGRQLTFRDYGAGDYFGELSAFDGQPSVAEVHTIEPSVVAIVDASTFVALVCQEPRVAQRVVRQLVVMVRQLIERFVDMSTLGVPSRLHAELLRRAHAAGVADNTVLLDPAPRHAELASRVGTNREQITRELGVLIREGLLVKESKALRITDVAHLERLVAEVRGIP